jgi:hypothetical protein
MDAVYIGTIALFFAMTWGILKMCEALHRDRTGEKA